MFNYIRRELSTGIGAKWGRNLGEIGAKLGQNWGEMGRIGTPE